MALCEWAEPLPVQGAEPPEDFGFTLYRALQLLYLNESISKYNVALYHTALYIINYRATDGTLFIETDLQKMLILMVTGVTYDISKKKKKKSKKKKKK